MRTIGVIGGSGLYEMPGLARVKARRLETPYGEPSDAFVVGELDGVRLVFLPRHGRGHRLSPTEVNARANIWGFKKLGVERIISFSAVGSMRERIAPGDMVVVDQYIDRTRARPSSFFGDGVVAHVPMADPFCAELGGVLAEAAESAGRRVHRGGTYLCIEGPQFSTRAESRLYRSWGVDVIGMTNLPEVRLAREAELCYATMALSTDYDCWHEGEADVTVDQVVAVMRENVEAAREVVRRSVARLAGERSCRCGQALAGAVMTAPEAITARARRRLELVAGDRLPRPPKGRKAKVRGRRSR